TLSNVLHPLILDELGLAACLRRYIEDFMKGRSIQVEFEVGPGIGRLPQEIEMHLFRVAQEGLSNILHHSESPNAIVRLRRSADLADRSLWPGHAGARQFVQRWTGDTRNAGASAEDRRAP